MEFKKYISCAAFSILLLLCAVNLAYAATTYRYKPVCNTTMTDENITTNVLINYAADRGLKYQNIHVATFERVVTLSGELQNYTQIKIANCLARSVPGVKYVISKLTIRHHYFDQP